MAQQPRKPAWSDVPPHIVAALEDVIGAPIGSGCMAFGSVGMSATFHVDTADGRRFFIKGTHPAEKAHGTKIIRQEVDILHRFPAIAALGARVHGLVGDGDEDGWLLAVFDHLDKLRDVPPWITVAENDLSGEPSSVAADAAAMIALAARAHRMLDAQAEGLPHVRDNNYWAPVLAGEQGWKKIDRLPQNRAGFITVFADADAGDDWLFDMLPHLMADQSRAPELPMDGLMHGDLRADNFIITATGPRLVDWPDACFGCPLIDVAAFIPGLAMTGAGDAADLYALYEQAAQRTYARDVVAVAVAAFASAYAGSAWRSVPDGLPMLRHVQQVHLAGALKWYADIKNLPPPPPFKIEEGLRS